MPYPSGNPKNKHKLLIPKNWPKDRSLASSEHAISGTIALLDALERPLVQGAKELSNLYTYSDAPERPISRDLIVVGVANQSLSLVRKTHLEPNCLHPCTVAVKRADRQYASHLKPQDVENSNRFADLMKRLRKEELVLILATDKYDRFYMIAPLESTENDPSLDFAATCYVAKQAAVFEYLTQAAKSSSSAPSQPQQNHNEASWQPPSDEGTWQPPAEDGGTWQPPAEDGGWQQSSANEGTWQPPTDEGGWQPPTDEPTSFENYDNGENSWESSSPPNKKQKLDEPDESNGFHQDAGAAAADRFYSGLTRSLDTRADSRLYHMRAFNGWVKATQIAELRPKTRGREGPLRVLDLACGKGGDLGKWVRHERGMSNYVGIDVARGSLKDAAIRARQIRKKLKRCTFTCADLGADVPGRFKSKQRKHLQKLLTWSLHQESEYEAGEPEFKMTRGGGVALDDTFNVISIQFAIHYMMQTRQRARRFFQTVSELLEVGGNLIATTIDARVIIGHMMNLGIDFHIDPKQSENGNPPEAIVQAGNGVCRLQFEPEVVKRIFHTAGADGSKAESELFGLEYTFTLREGSDHAAGVGDAVNLPEWLIPIPVLKALAEEAGLELEYALNFHEFYDQRKNASDFPDAHNAMYNMKVLNHSGSISEEEWDVSRLYAALKFRKVRDSGMQVEDEIAEGDDASDDEEKMAKVKAAAAAIDPAVRAKNYPKALMKAKKAVGFENWKDLSSEEKKTLTEVELVKLAGNG